MRERPQPWFLRALQVLDLRKKDRVLLAEPGSVASARAVQQAIGPHGELTVLAPHRPRAQAIAVALPAADGLAVAIDGDDRFGTFDAVLASPFAGPLPPVASWGALLHANLRPGGRFALDLPAPTLLPDVLTASRALPPPCADRIAAVLSGPEGDEVLAALQPLGLRRVETLLGTHLLTFGSPLDLLDLIVDVVRMDEDERSALGDALVRTLGTTAEVETLAHRNAVTGMR
jgi:hypothetical protein